MKILVLGLGNEIMGDDAVGLVAAQELRGRLSRDVDVVLTEEAGLSLLDLVAGYDRVIVLDAISSGREAGELLEFDLGDLSSAPAACRHGMSLAEVLAVGRRLGLGMPAGVTVLSMEIADPHMISVGITPVAARSLPHMIDRATGVVAGWQATGRAAVRTSGP